MRYLIIGGTGTLGNEIVRRLYEKHEIHVFSRDEYKQYNLKKVYPKVKCILGDIRNIDDLNWNFDIYDSVFHCAALKHVDIGESNVEQFIQTNLHGTINVSKKCLEANTRMVFFSTDKAVLPINTYGFTKALAEKYLSSQSGPLVIFRWGNIIGSRGSIVPFFADLIRNEAKVPITHLDMTRFWMALGEAVDYVMSEFNKDQNDHKILIPPVKSARVMDIAQVIGKILNKTVHFKEIGIRPGEKIHEHLYSDHDHCLRSDKCKQYTQDELIIKIQSVGLT